jgi:hypothetical protein
MLTKKDLVQFARIILDEPDKMNKQAIADAVMDVASIANPRFVPERFAKAAGLRRFIVSVPSVSYSVYTVYATHSDEARDSVLRGNYDAVNHGDQNGSYDQDSSSWLVEELPL